MAECVEPVDSVPSASAVTVIYVDVLQYTTYWFINIYTVTYTTAVGMCVTNNSTTRVRIGYRIYSLWRL
jgi:hypothetical protein